MSRRVRKGFVDEFDEPGYRSFQRNRDGRNRDRLAEEERPRSHNRNRTRPARRGHDDD
ncbi:hypothetical protein [Sedimenticola hydrogenitrophicus]|uniref:hypothetical protein n=1 Tax=Sedimenticola hydrogenitrophicus TaxID=2967975 RepID=UPI0023AFBC9A|nr:hypothetical protein [Sedimenticola hydrogenitrophicus]